MLLSVFNKILMLLLYMCLTLLCIPTEYEAGEVGIGKMDMAYGSEVISVKIASTSRDYIVGMLDVDVIFIPICFMIIYRTND